MSRVLAQWVPSTAGVVGQWLRQKQLYDAVGMELKRCKDAGGMTEYRTLVLSETFECNVRGEVSVPIAGTARIPDAVGLYR